MEKTNQHNLSKNALKKLALVGKAGSAVPSVWTELFAAFHDFLNRILKNVHNYYSQIRSYYAAECWILQNIIPC